MTTATPRPADYAAARAIGVRLGLIGLPLAAVNLVIEALNVYDEAALGQFGPVPGVRDVAFTLDVAVWLLLLGLAGFLAARRTGYAQAAVVAGFIASLLDGLIYVGASSVIWGVLYPLWETSETSAALRTPILPPTIRTVVGAFLDLLVIFGLSALLAGSCCGFLGGAIGLLLHRRHTAGSASATGPEPA